MAGKPKLPSMEGGKSEGQIADHQKFAEPNTDYATEISNMGGTQNDIGEKSGYQTSGYITKKGTPYGEAAKLNFLPPGMDISDQENKDIREMTLKKLTDLSYPGDGAF